MNEIFNTLGPQIEPLVSNLLLTVITIIFGILGTQASILMQKVKDSKQIKDIREKLERNKEVVEISVAYVEQVGKHLASADKFSLAKTKAIELANESGFKITEEELDVLIEQAVLAFHGGYKQDAIIEAEEVNVVDFDSEEEIDEDLENNQEEDVEETLYIEEDM